MKIIKVDNTDNIFPYYAYIPDNIGSNPALLIQLHGSGERGNGKDELDIALRYGFSHIINDENFTDCIFVAPQCTKDTFWCAKIDLVCRIFKFCQAPELFSGNDSIHIVCNVIVNLVICHGTDNNVMFMSNSVTAGNNEIKPFFCHFFKFQNPSYFSQ